jgi:CDP-diacylglycerol--glycerol-3-phosphate 3-phosphatidyltransferase
MYRQFPNLLTLMRLVFAAIFFVVLNQYRYATDPVGAMLLVAIVVFVMAAITDSLDGYLARRWKVESTFGRIMDPFCDKVLVMGAFIYLAGPRFVMPQQVAAGSFFNMISGVYPWMVAVILARELLVTAVRGELESQGVAFGANWFGKIKMIMQSTVIPIVLFIIYLDPTLEGLAYLAVIRDVLIYTTVLATVLSGIPYITKAVTVMKG